MILEAKDLAKLSETLLKQTKLIEEVSGRLEAINYAELKQKEDAYKLVTDKLAQASQERKTQEAVLEMWTSKKEKATSDLQNALALLREFKQQEQNQTKKKEIQAELVRVTECLEELEDEVQEAETALIGFSLEIASEQRKIEMAEEHNKELATLLRRMKVLEAYKAAVHSNGLPFFIVKQNTGRINDYISSVLTDIVDFDVFLQCTESKLMIMIQHPGQEARTI